MFWIPKVTFPVFLRSNVLITTVGGYVVSLVDQSKPLGMFSLAYFTDKSTLSRRTFVAYIKASEH